VSLAKLSGDLGVVSVTSSDRLAGWGGRTHWQNGAPHITLAAGATGERRRWSWAHELAHVMVSRRDIYASELGRRLDTGGLAEERLCDDIARALLVPPGALIDPELDDLDAASRLIALATRCGVPTAAAARRICDLLAVTTPLVSLYRTGELWTADLVLGAAFSSMLLGDGDGKERLSTAVEAARPFRLRVRARIDNLECVVLLQGRLHLGEIWAEVKDIHAPPAGDSANLEGPSMLDP
jgi:IrrE N-terminal-like domain